MSPPAEIYIVLPSVYVRPSVCACVTIPLSEPYLPESFVQKVENVPINNIPTEVVQQQKKIQFCQFCFEVLGKKKLFEFMFCSCPISVTIKGRDTGIFCSVSKNVPIVQLKSQFCKVSNFGRF